MSGDKFFRSHPVLANIIIICLIGVLGILIVYFSLSLFTRHGENDTVPKVENMSYTEAIKTLHDKGFRTDIRDSVYNEDVEPGFVIEQFPSAGSHVKPGRKIFLYINAVHPREVVIDTGGEENSEALKGYSLRQGLAKLEELGFRNVDVVTIPGDNDRIIRILGNGKTISNMQRVPVTAKITVEVCDGQLNNVIDSLQNEEYLQFMTEDMDYNQEDSDEEDFLFDSEPVFVQ